MTTSIAPQDELTTDEMLQTVFNEATDSDELAWLATSDNHNVAYSIIKHPNVSYGILRTFMNEEQHADTRYDGYNYEGISEAAEEEIAERFAEVDPEDYDY